MRAMVEQAVKTKALASLYYGKAPKYTYYDGHSQGGRQGMKIMQEYPELYDGYMIAQPAPNIAKFGTSALYPQIVMKTELGYTAVNKAEAKAFADKVAAANVRAVAACDTAGLGFLLDPFACNYNPARDAAALCTGAAGDGVTGSNADAATCLSAKEATALNKIWYGETSDGSFDAAQTPDSPQRQGARRQAGVVDLYPRHRHRRPDHQRRHRQPCARTAGRQLRRRRQRHILDSDHQRLDGGTQQMARTRLCRARRCRCQERRAAADAVQRSHHRQGRS